MSLGEIIKDEQEYLDKWIAEHKDASTEEIEEFARERVSTLPDRIKAEGVDYEAELRGYMWNRIKEDGIAGLLFTFLLFLFSPFPNNKPGNQMGDAGKPVASKDAFKTVGADKTPEVE